ncbi:hypothetical protein D9758_003013 [Tetrapyrgos nigripes]|uniref:RRM domain-containing protein n=1 Tax=Tetrapyrgos nigripes TaxID=182062 RepID=A0A8H5LTK4_9AGAR|nr:hypothetical protein D9758_003013 [Tetrapyrgos nigripes]
MSAFRRGSRKPYARPPPRDTNSQWVHDKAPGFNDNSKISLNGNSPSFPSNTEGNTKLLVSNLHYEITPQDLVAIFGQIGTLVREPLIRYDRSGRSSGTAVISYETPEEAAKAKKQFHGILAKGQPMEINFDTFVPRHARASRSVSAPTHSLLNRIQKPALADRLAADDIDIDRKGGGIGPIRSRRGRGGKPNTTTTTGPGTSKYNNKSSGKSAPKHINSKPKTADELDKELDAFMGEGEGVQSYSTVATASTTPVEGGEGGAPASAVAAAVAVAGEDAAATQDVEMA